LRKEILGHVANRLQIALWKEVLYLIQQDVLSVSDADAAVSWGPGLRWGIMGPSLQFHLGGGAGGMKHFMAEGGVFDGLQPVFRDLGNPEITPAFKQKVIDGVLKEAGDRSVEQLAKRENELLVELIRLRAQQARALEAETHA